MSSPNYGLEIAENFQKYLKTGDEDLIKNYTSRELRVAISRLSPWYDNNKQWYREMERRITALATQEESQKKRVRKFRDEFREKWLDKLAAFSLGLVAGITIMTF